MRNPKEILFSVNEYDQDGDCIEKGIFLHFGDAKIMVADNLEEFEEIIPYLQNMIDEIKQNYPNA